MTFLFGDKPTSLSAIATAADDDKLVAYDADAAATKTMTRTVFMAPPLPLGAELTLKRVAATSGALTGATDTIELAIPAGCLVLAVSMNVETAVVDDAGDDTWSAELNDGSTVQALGAGVAAAKNTKLRYLGAVQTDAETDIVLTPNGGNFSSGEIRAVAYYIELDELADAA